MSAVTISRSLAICDIHYMFRGDWELRICGQVQLLAICKMGRRILMIGSPKLWRSQRTICFVCIIAIRSWQNTVVLG